MGVFHNILALNSLEAATLAATIVCVTVQLAGHHASHIVVEKCYEYLNITVEVIRRPCQGSAMD